MARSGWCPDAGGVSSMILDLFINTSPCHSYQQTLFFSSYRSNFWIYFIYSCKILEPEPFSTRISIVHSIVTTIVTGEMWWCLQEIVGCRPYPCTLSSCWRSACSHSLTRRCCQKCWHCCCCCCSDYSHSSCFHCCCCWQYSSPFVRATQLLTSTAKFLWAAQDKRFKKIQKGTNGNLQEPSGTFRNLQEPSGTACKLL